MGNVENVGAPFGQIQPPPEDKQRLAEPIFNRVLTTLSVLKGDMFRTPKLCRCTHLYKAVKAGNFNF